MASLLKLSDAGALALHAGIYLAAHGGGVCRAAAVADGLRVSEAHLVKVLQRLERAGLVRAARGPRGGYALARPPARIRLRDLFEATEGPLAPVRCLLKQTVCAGRPCILGGLVRQVNRQVIATLSGTTLEHLLDRGWRERRPRRISNPTHPNHQGD